jgi:hypothetical protein
MQIMDDLIATGAIALVIFYAGLLFIACAVLFLCYILVSSIISGNRGLFLLIIGCILCAGALYGATGFLLRRKGII